MNLGQDDIDDYEDTISTTATTAETIEQLEQEVSTLLTLEERAAAVFALRNRYQMARIGPNS